jgi:oligopeptide transport system substrate-binding protein
LKNVIAIAVGRNHSMALDDNGDVYTWGANSYGQLGLGDTKNRSVPSKVTLPKGASEVKSIAAGGHHSMALDKAGNLYTWGANGCGQLGLGTTKNGLKPSKVTLPKGASRVNHPIAAGDSHSMAEMLFGDRRVLCAWGKNNHGQLGIGTMFESDYEDQEEPNSVVLKAHVDFTDPKMIVAGYMHSLAVKGNQLLCWGSNEPGQCAQKRGTREIRIPKNIQGSLNAKILAIAAGRGHTLVLVEKGEGASAQRQILAVGLNTYGQLGLGHQKDSREFEVVAFCGVSTLRTPTPTPKSAPTEVPAAPPAPTIAGGEELAKELNVNLGYEPSSLDPSLATDSASFDCDEQLFLGLTDFEDSTDARVIPELATEWSASSDGLTWTFKMRKDARWVHYDPGTSRFEVKRSVTAHDIVYGVKRTCNPETASEFSYLDYIIAGCMDVNTGESTDMDSIGVRAIDDHTVEFALREPGAYFPAIAGMWVNRPVPREAIEEHGDTWTEPGNIWTNGPFALDTWEHENKLILVKNPHFYGARDLAIEQINGFMVVEASTALAMYENGELDVVAVPLENVDRVQADPLLSRDLFSMADLATYFYGFNTTKPPVNDVRVRQALAYTIDRQLLVDTVMKGGRLPAWSFASPGIFGNVAANPDFPGISFDPQKGRDLLAEAGYPGGAGFPKMMLIFNTSEGNQKIAEFVQANWREYLGIEVELGNQEWRVYLQTLSKDAPQVWRLTWGGDYPDQNSWLPEVFHPTEGANRPQWSGPAADRFAQLVEDAAAETDPEERKCLYFEAEKLLCVDDAVIIPIYHYARVGCTKPYVERTLAFAGVEHWWKWKVKAH